ncbi:VanZ family protein [Falsiroseomonas sp.]|uniref:VanZ family protein n=1 Tax=Falsiroseomonas sp. TaxID=2870721 RepID=UPI003563E942
MSRITETRRPILAAILLALLMAGFIAYGSLYPFRFHPLPERMPLAEAVAQAWALRSTSRGDLAANLLLYAPLGLVLALAFARLRPLPATVLAVLLCALLSAGLEFAQIFAMHRVASGGDLVLNIVGAGLGAATGTVLAPRRGAEALAWRPRVADAFPAALLACWVGYRLYPYVPALDLGEWRASLKPLLPPFDPDPLRILRLAILWLVAARMLDAARPRGEAGLLLAVLMLGSLVAAVPLVGRRLTVEEIAAVGLALPAWLVLRRLSWRDRLLFAALLFVVLLEGLAPYTFLAEPRPFGWIPLRSLMSGHWGNGLQAVLYKSFLYGGLVWLGLRAGLRPLLAGGFAVAVALAVSAAQAWLPGRSAEITDAVIAAGTILLLQLLRGGRWPGEPRVAGR